MTELEVPHAARDAARTLGGIGMSRDVREIATPVVTGRLRWHAGRYAVLAEKYASAEFWRVSQELLADADELDGGGA